MNLFAGTEFHFKVKFLNGHFLIAEAFNIYLDSSYFSIVTGVMPKSTKIEGATQLAVNARQDIQVESRGDAESVVVCSLQSGRVFFQVCSQKQRIIFLQHAAHRAQKFKCIMLVEVADIRTEE